MKYFLYCRKSTEDEERQVLSLPSQRESLDRAFGDKCEIEIVEFLEESKSAKTPGRPVFAEMIDRIERGEAQGILSWAPDRLARNSIDGGRIVYLLDTGALRDLKFATYTFENNSQGKFMLSIMFGQSKYYSDALSENVKRGNRTKLERGWRPNRAPLGYLNDSATRTIIPDPERFPLVRRIFEKFLSESLSPRQIAMVARGEWGFRTPTCKRSGGKPIALSTIYRILGNPFYEGSIRWNGETYPGAHLPIVTGDEFSRVQTLLKRQGQPRPQKHAFTFTGLVRCGVCGMMVTAEKKINRYGSHYTYYHCTRRSLAGRCREPSVNDSTMVKAFASFLASLEIDPEIERWVYDRLLADSRQAADEDVAAEASRTAAATAVSTQLKELTGLRLRQLVTDEEFAEERGRLQREGAALEQPGARGSVDRFELFASMVSFSKYAVEWFLGGDPDTQRFIVQIAGSNFTLTARKLSGLAVKPFRQAKETPDRRILCGVVEDVRTSESTLDAIPQSPKTCGKTLDASALADGTELLRSIEECLDLPETKALLEKLTALHNTVGVVPDGLGHGLRTSAGRGQAARPRSLAPPRVREPRGERERESQ